jgi:small subunit ribosomal protein S11
MAKAKETKTTKATATKKPEKVKVKKKKVKLTSPKVLVSVHSTYNNTLVTISAPTGETVSAASAGTVGFSGSKKSTAYAATKAGEQAADKAFKLGARECTVVVKGAGVGRQAAVKGIRSAGLRITSLSDHTPIPHGGCKPRKAPKK